jgi:hypothetical protein
VDAHCAPSSSSTAPTSAPPVHSAAPSVECDPGDALLLRIDSVGADLLSPASSVYAFCGRLFNARAGDSRPPLAVSSDGVEGRRRTSFDHQERAETPAVSPSEKDQG